MEEIHPVISVWFQGLSRGAGRLGKAVTLAGSAVLKKIASKMEES